MGLLVEYIAELKELGEERFALAHDHPVLVREEDWDDGTPAFQTEVFSKDEMLQKLAAAKGIDPSEGGVGDVFPITKRKGGAFAERIGIGRARSVDVCVFLAKMSKYHAYVTETDGSFAITDAGSKNGTKVDGELLEPKEQRPLTDRAKVEFGPYTFTFFTAQGFREYLKRRSSAA